MEMTRKEWIISIVIGLILGSILSILLPFPYKTDSFKDNYRIDLKQNGYLVYKSHNGEVVFVEFGELEEFFLDDNL